MARQNWSREETILAFDLYCKIPFGQIHHTNPKVIQLASLIGRTPSSVSMKMCNLAAHDSAHQQRGVRGLAHGCKMEGVVWDEFHNDWEGLAIESARILDELRHGRKLPEIQIGSIPEGEVRERLVNQRIGQSFFRAAVLSSYENRCCITGINVSSFLIASHIKPWAKSDSKRERTNPTNGLCLNALHDRAFDQGFITLDDQYRLVVSSKLKEKRIDECTKNWIVKFEGQEICLPHRFSPQKEFLEYHRDVVFFG